MTFKTRGNGMIKQMESFFLSIVLVLGLCACGQDTAAAWQEQYDLGVKYLSEGNYEEAIIAFTAAIEIDPKQIDSYPKAVEAYEALGRVDEARALLERALEQMEDETLRQLYLRLCRTNDPYYDQLSEDERALLSQLTAAVLAEDWTVALSIQSSQACQALVNALPENEEGDRLSLCFYPDDQTRVTFFRGADEREVVSHVDIFQGADGQGDFIASVYSPDHYYMNIVPFTAGEVSGDLTSYNRRWEDDGVRDYTVTGTLESGAPKGPVHYIYNDGSVREDEGEGFTSWPVWPEELTK